MSRKKAPPVPKSQAELDYSEFGNTLRKLIKAKGYTQENFAKAIGVSYSSLMSILKGDRKVYLNVYVKMIDVLGISDLVVMSRFAEQPELVEKANSYMKLVSKCEDLSPELLECIVKLVSDVKRRD